MRIITSFSQYVELALVTESIERDGRWQAHIPDDVFRVNHALTGIATEIGELVEAVVINKTTDKVNLHEEIGDVWWYLAILAHQLDVIKPISHVCDTFLAADEYTIAPDHPAFSLPGALLCMSYDLGNAFDVVKRRIYYNATDTAPKSSWSLVSASAIAMATRLLDITSHAKANLRKIWATNIDKLATRYPDKFSEHDALHRDENAERGVLEGGSTNGG